MWGLRYLDDLVLRDRGSERFYALHDYYNCTAIADTTGTVQERYGYNAYGFARVMDASFNLRTASLYDWETRYGAYRWDGETGFYQVRKRYLHPTLGRWLSRDPIGYRDGYNLYYYVNDNSINAIDAFGLQTNFTVSWISASESNSPCSFFGWQTNWKQVQHERRRFY